MALESWKKCYSTLSKNDKKCHGSPTRIHRRLREVDMLEEVYYIKPEKSENPTNDYVPHRIPGGPFVYQSIRNLLVVRAPAL